MGRILHFGLGNFARAHLLDYTADAGGWDVVGVSLRHANVRDGLAVQAFEYDLCVQGFDPKRIKILSNVLVAPESPRTVLDAVQEADIISATVTEKGYHLDAQGNLDLTDPVITSDLAGNGPASLIGFLAFGLSRRTTPATIMCCDNRTENGAALKRAVMQFAQAAGITIDFTRFSFPNAMVDRITPATTDAVRAMSGDPMAVPTEPFREWVIEDDFKGPRPDWPDVQFAKDVAPHELRKLRMLNGAHSLLAYAGLERGHDYVHQAIADPVLRAQAMALMTAAAGTLPQGANDPDGTYAAALIARFENPYLDHALRQIAMDGSQKALYRFVATIRDCDTGADAVLKGLSAWVRFCIAETKAGRALADPKAQAIADAVASDDPVSGVLHLIEAADLAGFIRV